MGFNRAQQGKKTGETVGRGSKSTEDGRYRRRVPKARLSPDWFHQHLSVSGPRNGTSSHDDSASE